MTNLSVIEHEGIFVVDSRLIAQELGIEHETFLKTIRKYESKIEQRFGRIRFEFFDIPMPKGGIRQEIGYALLTEPQATILMTFSRNTSQVVECKIKLVEAFEKAKQIIKEVIPAQSDRLRELELELELAKTQERLSINQQKLLATVHLLETVSPGLAPLALGKQDAVVERVEYIDRVITPGKTYEGVGVTYIQKRFGFKSTQDTWNWLNSVGYSKDSGRWEIQPNVSHYHKIHPSKLAELDKLFYRKKGTRQRLIGE